MKGLVSYRSIKEIDDPSTLPDGIIREENERVKRTLDLINSMALEIASAGPEEDIYSMMADKIRSITGAFAVNISTYQEETSEMEQRAISLKRGFLKKAESILGGRLRNQRYKVKPEIKMSMMSDVIAISDDLYEASLGSIPKITARLIEKTFSLKNFVGVSLVYKKELYGTIFIILNRDSPPIDYEILGVIKGIGSQLFHRRSVENELRDFETRYSNLFMDSQDAVVITSRDGVIQESNPAFIEMTGLETGQGSVVSLNDLGMERTAGAELIAELERDGSIRNFPFEVKGKAGDIRFCLVNASLRRGKDGTVLGYQGMIRDFSEFRKLSRDLEKERNNAELYLDLLGHDVGNLHQGIDNSLSLISVHREDHEKTTLLLSHAKDLLEKSKDLSKNIKILARLRRGNLELHQRDLNEICRGEMERMGSVFPSKDLDVGFESFEKSIPVKVDRMAEQVVFNLLHNAIKAQQHESPWVRVVTGFSKNESYAYMKVMDKGNGMPEEIRSYLIQDVESSVRKHAGLGLSIVRELVRIYGGEIYVMARIPEKPDQGTRIEVRFPNDNG